MSAQVRCTPIGRACPGAKESPMLDHDHPPKTAVIVEDDPDVRHMLAGVLEAAGFSTVSVGNGIDGVRAVLTYQPLITTLDVNMPGIDGFEAARRIREQSDTYIIMLTALDEEADVVLGLSAGADEYLNKPFRPRELRARIDALLRRPRATGAQPAVATPRQEQGGRSFPSSRSTLDAAPAQPWPDQPAASRPASFAPVPEAMLPGPPAVHPGSDDAGGQASRQTIIIGDDAGRTPGTGFAPAPDGSGDQDGWAAASEEGVWIAHRDLRLDPDTRIVLIQGRELELTRTEFDLLAALMESKRRVRSKADLTLVLRGESYVTSYFVGEADKRAIEAHMTNLRRKLGDNPVQPRYIETVRGVGYRLTADTSA